MNARQDVCLVGLNFHTAATAVSLLSPPEVPVYKFLVDTQSGGQAGEKCDQSFAVRLPGSEVAQHKQLILTDEGQRYGEGNPRINGFLP
jgi:uncharacterized protein YlaN (UPF0358 family)